MNWTGCSWVESVPERMGGVVVLVDTRMDAEGVLLNFDDGMTAEEITGEFGVDPIKVRDVLEFAGRLRQRSAA